MGILSHTNGTRMMQSLRYGGSSFAARRPLIAATCDIPSYYNSTTPLLNQSSRIYVIGSGSKAHFTSTRYVLSDTMKNKLGLGGNNWSRMEPEQYQKIIAQGLEAGITTIEAGQEGGDQALLDAFKKAQETLDNNSDVTKPVTMTLRIGYRTIMPSSETESKDESKQPQDPPVEESFRGDVAVEQHPFLGPNRTMTPLDDEELSLKPPASLADDQMVHILHNTSEGYIHNQLAASPLVKEYQNNPSASKNMNIVALLHNPEAQIMDLANEHDINEVSLENRQIFLKSRLVDSFCALEKAVADKQITSYGVASNGLVLPSEHPLAISTDTILEAVQLAMAKTNSKKCHLSVIQLPVNLMERTGLEIAQRLYAKIHATDDEECQHLRDSPPLEIYAMRPLTCYPDRGTGTGHAFRLVDYLLPSGPKHHEQVEVIDEEGVKEEDIEGEAQELKEEHISDEDLTSKQWSNRMDGPPLIYSIALKKAMAHFDAETLLEEKMKRDLSSEERETLDGCKLLQSMLHDLDAGLAEIRSLGAHEQDLYTRIIPLIDDTFEGYDEETADVLGMFFKCYSLAVRYSIARNTRNLLQSGGDDSRGCKYESIPDEEKLQDYALKYLLKEAAISKVIVGATKPDHVAELVKSCDRMVEESTEEN